MTKADMTIETKLIHAGEPQPLIEGAVSLPVFQSATFEYTGQSQYDDLKYIRLNNTPNHKALHQKLAAIENAEAALVTASGMAAISTTLLSLLRQGDHLLIQECLYGGTYDFIVHDLPKLGITFDFIDETDPAKWSKLLRPTTKVIYVESMTNPLLGVIDLETVSAFAQKHGLVSIIDNTFPSPINFRPAEWGFDLSLHSCTKYLNGHSDIVAGAIIGRADLIGQNSSQAQSSGRVARPPCLFSSASRHENAGRPDAAPQQKRSKDRRISGRSSQRSAG